MFIRCNQCGHIVDKKNHDKNFGVCQVCGNYKTLTSYERINMLLDEDSFYELHKDMGFSNPIDFPEYENKYNTAQKSTGLNEAIIIGKGKIEGIKVMIGVMEPAFMMGSMGTTVGEKISDLFDTAERLKLPVIFIAASGGARMQEGIISLMQMAKVSEVIQKFSAKGGLLINILTDPTTGGVCASIGFLGDIILAEPKALIGFAGKRVIEQTINEKLPPNFQTAEFLLEHGFIDSIVERFELKNTLYKLLKYHY